MRRGGFAASVWMRTTLRTNSLPGLGDDERLAAVHGFLD
ncbi:hypothetical protein LMG28727_07469 [Paraburkholderia kirstenboschensis]|nr:hypothetical protein LMG28727_07469 [Paraburkholderia kirstenboschensis]